jgi:hypothetical protein
MRGSSVFFRLTRSKRAAHTSLRHLGAFMGLVLAVPVIAQQPVPQEQEPEKPGTYEEQVVVTASKVEQ